MDFSQDSVTVLPHRALKEEDELQSTVHYATMCLLLMVSVTTSVPRLQACKIQASLTKGGHLKLFQNG